MAPGREDVPNRLSISSNTIRAENLLGVQASTTRLSCGMRILESCLGIDYSSRRFNALAATVQSRLLDGRNSSSRSKRSKRECVREMPRADREGSRAGAIYKGYEGVKGSEVREGSLREGGSGFGSGRSIER